MRKSLRLTALASIAVLMVAACSSGASPTPAPTAAPTVAPTAAPGSQAPATEAPTAAPTVDPNSLLGKVMAKGKIVMSTDAQYPPQSQLDPKSPLGYSGFDIDVGSEIAKRLGVKIEFITPAWSLITAGSWGRRWDFSVGSMTITPAREKALSFTKPYYYTPAQMAASTVSGITTIEGLAGKTICVAEATTYYDWLIGSDARPSVAATPPPGSKAFTLKTDRLCAEAWKAGRKEAEGWLSSSTTVEQAIADGLPLVKIGDAVFHEPLGVAFDKSGPDPTSMIAKVNEILDAMRADGTLKGFSEKWLGLDLTTPPAE